MLRVPPPSREADERCAAAFQVLDEGSLRSDLARRREIKVLFRGADLAKLRRAVEGYCRRQTYNEDHQVSTVRSIYFDDPRFSACRANLDGLARRRKVRLRWYDTLWPEHDFFFEIKWRENRTTGKHRLQMRSRQPLHGMPYKRIFSELMRALPDECAHELMVYGDPTALIEYKREHFVAATDNGFLRMTLDYDLAVYNQIGKSFISTSFAHRAQDFLLLEGKVPVGRELELMRVLNPLRARVDSCSKYVLACRMLGLVPPSD